MNLALESYQVSPEDQRKSFINGLVQLETLRDAGKDVLAVIQSVDGFEPDIEESLLRLSAESSSGSITSLVLTPFRDQEQAWDELRAPYSSQVTLDRNRALRNLYPAIDPLRSMSAIDRMVVSDRHRTLLKIVIDLFTSCGDLDEILDKEGKPSEEFQCQADLIGYLTQPFRITEPFRGTPGESVSEEKMLDGVQSILAHHGLTV